MNSDDCIRSKRSFPWQMIGAVALIVTALIAIGGRWETINQHDLRITRIEQQMQQTSEILSEVRGDVKVLLERTKEKRP